MSGFAEGLRRALEERDALARLGERVTLARAVEDAQRELDELKGKIPLWDRLKVFSDSPDEARKKALTAQLKEQTPKLTTLDAEVEGALAEVEEGYPPFALGREIESCFLLARDGLRCETGRRAGHVIQQQNLERRLRKLADRVLETYVPDYDPAAFEVLTEPERAREVAVSGDARPPTHATLGVAPLETAELAPWIARGLLDGPFFEAREAMHALQARRDAQLAAVDQSRDKVSLFDRVNVFGDSDAQRAVKQGQAELATLELELGRAVEEAQTHLHNAQEIYPPLAVHQGVLEVLGVLELVAPDVERGLSRQGQLIEVAVVRAKGLVLACFRRLMRVFHEAFPEVPFPLALRHEPQPERGDTPTARAVAACWEALDQGRAAALRDRAIQHGEMAAAREQALAHVGKRISLANRLVFWHDTADQSAEDRLEQSRDWHRDQARAAWEALLEEAAEVVANRPLLHLRTLTVKLVQRVEALKTQDHEDDRPVLCDVLGRDAALEVLERVGTVIGEAYGLHGTREQVMEDVAKRALELGPSPDAPTSDDGAVDPLPYPEVVTRIAERLRGTRFAERFEQVRAQQDTKRSLKAERDRTAKLSAWDKVNVLASLSKARRREALETDLKGLSAELRNQLFDLHEEFEHALHAYVPARVYFALGGVKDRLLEVSAYSDQFVRRKETLYRCVLRGEALARTSTREWASRVMSTFGPAPSLHDFLESWELDALQHLTAPMRQA